MSAERQASESASLDDDGRISGSLVVAVPVKARALPLSIASIVLKPSPDANNLPGERGIVILRISRITPLIT
jgi:hypothetical protein